MQFKYKKIAKEYSNPDNINPRLRAFLLWLEDKCMYEWGKEIFITCLGRTLTQNIKRGGKPNSFHLTNPVSAADIRTTHSKWFTRIEQETIKKWFDEEHACWGHDRCLIESDHIHVQMEFSKNKDMDEVEIVTGVQ